MQSNTCFINPLEYTTAATTYPSADGDFSS